MPAGTSWALYGIQGGAALVRHQYRRIQQRQRRNPCMVLQRRDRLAPPSCSTTSFLSIDKLEDTAPPAAPKVPMTNKGPRRGNAREGARAMPPRVLRDCKAAGRVQCGSPARVHPLGRSRCSAFGRAWCVRDRGVFACVGKIPRGGARRSKAWQALPPHTAPTCVTLEKSNKIVNFNDRRWRLERRHPHSSQAPVAPYKPHVLTGSLQSAVGALPPPSRATADVERQRRGGFFWHAARPAARQAAHPAGSGECPRAEAGAHPD